MLKTKNYEFWFLTGSQDLYGDECLRIVAEHSHKIVDGLNAGGRIPYPVVWKPTLIDSVSIRETLAAANADPNVAGCIVWMHTFSPAKMWIRGFNEYRKPLLHLHTQFNREIPFDTIDMDFMNQNQSAHGDREFAHMLTRMGTKRKTVSGYWADADTQTRIAEWTRTAVGALESRSLRILRVGDNMRDVSVTEGDKVEAEQVFGWEIDAYNITDVDEYVRAVPENEVNALTDEYYDTYDLIYDGRDPAEFRAHVAEQARIEIGFRNFVEEHDYHAVVTSFQMLAGLRQLPGLAMQRMMRGGRLEDGGRRPSVQADDGGQGRRDGNVVHGGLHVRSDARTRGDTRSAYARGLPDDSVGEARYSRMPAFDGQPRGPGASRVHGEAGTRRRMLARRSRHAFPHDNQRGRVRHAG